MARGTRSWLALVGVLTIGIVMAAPAAATAGGDPPGNNGTIKIDGKPFDDAPDNEPHPGCVFQVDFYGFDAGNLNADVTFEAVAPTAGGVLLTDTVPIGEDSHSGGGSEAGLDASKTYDLSSELAGIEPQQNQGWHVRLTVHADGSQGSDVKHKVFWVDDCAATTVSESGAPESGATGSTATHAVGGEATGGSGTTGGVTGSAPEASPSMPETVPARVLGIGLAAPATPETTSAPVEAAPATASVMPAEVLGESVSRAPASATGPSSLARTGIGLGLAVVALVLLGVGLALRRMGTLRLPRLGS